MIFLCISLFRNTSHHVEETVQMGFTASGWCRRLLLYLPSLWAAARKCVLNSNAMIGVETSQPQLRVLLGTAINALFKMTTWLLWLPAVEFCTIVVVRYLLQEPLWEGVRSLVMCVQKTKWRENGGLHYWGRMSFEKYKKRCCSR